MRNAHEAIKDEEISGPIKIWLAHAKERLDREKGKNRGGDKNDPENVEELD